MGAGRWSADDWKAYASTTASKPRSAIFRSSSVRDIDELLPRNIKVRESVDSAANPNSTPIILSCDVTGSMGELAEIIVKKGLGIVMGEIYTHKPISDPHIMIMATGDAYCDRAPLQMTQFEATVEAITPQVEKIWIEGGGGGNAGESYLMAHYAAAFMTKCDAITKRNRKGYLFTIGDEPPLPLLTRQQIKNFIGRDEQKDYTREELRDIAMRDWEVFHLIVKPVRTAVEDWRALLGQRAIMVENHKKLAEVVVSTIRVMEGEAAEKVAASWSGSTAVVVAKAVSDLATVSGGSVARKIDNSEVVWL